MQVVCIMMMSNHFLTTELGTRSGDGSLVGVAIIAFLVVSNNSFDFFNKWVT